MKTEFNGAGGVGGSSFRWRQRLRQSGGEAKMAFDTSGSSGDGREGGAASASASAGAVMASPAVVGDNSDNGRGGDGGGSSDGGCVDSGGGGSVDGGSVDNDVSDDDGCGGGDGCDGGAETVMTAVATAMVGVKRQQSTCNGSVKGGRWTRARQRVTTNNKNAWPMMRVATKRAARAMATVTRVASERRQRW